MTFLRIGLPAGLIFIYKNLKISLAWWISILKNTVDIPDQKKKCCFNTVLFGKKTAGFKT